MNTFKDTYEWFSQFDGKHFGLETSERTYEFHFDIRSIPHLLGIQYAFRSGDRISPSKRDNLIKYASDEDILQKVQENNPEYLESVTRRTSTIKYFFEHIDEAFIVEKSNLIRSRIKSSHLVVKDHSGDYLQLGLKPLVGEVFDDEQSLFCLETYFTRKDDHYFKKPLCGSPIKSVLIKESGLWKPYSFELGRCLEVKQVPHKTQAQERASPKQEIDENLAVLKDMYIEPRKTRSNPVRDHDDLER